MKPGFITGEFCLCVLIDGSSVNTIQLQEKDEKLNTYFVRAAFGPQSPFYYLITIPWC